MIIKKNIDDKIKEAKTFIKENIIPEIDNINKELDEKINKLINETIKLQDDANNNNQDWVEQEKKLNKSLMLRKIFGNPIKIPPG
ncbi:10345_t:CDS:2 [Cetraspora pellucida]|uniref:10345_t:CDS:1 n=1 Tax=Cetraspora pellucida TaxID=1433469 RepID=A0ACA9K9J3_9GLOM|nr:10345_t:CDS:2 [Cetraspora pellucida]